MLLDSRLQLLFQLCPFLELATSLQLLNMQEHIWNFDFPGFLNRLAHCRALHMHTDKPDWTSLSDELWCTIFAHVKDLLTHRELDLLYDDQAQYELYYFYDMRR